MPDRTIIEFATLLLTALALVPSMAHVLELPNELRLPRERYVLVQRICRGWALTGIVVVSALAAALLLTLRAGPDEFIPALMALLALVATQIVLWSLTFPVNRRTRNWTVVPQDWVPLRNRWEYSHARSALFNLLAVVCAAVAVLADHS